MKIEIWLDPVCIYCYIGVYRLEKVLNLLQIKDFVTLEWRSFLPFSEFQFSKKITIVDLLRKKYCISRKQAELLCKDFYEIVFSEGLTIQIDRIIPCNSYQAHRLLQMARHFHLQTELVKELFSSYFTDGKDFNELSVLADIGQKVGIPKSISMQMYDGDYMTEIRRDINKAKQLQLLETPGFLLNGKVFFSGLFSIEQLSDLIRKTYLEFQTKRHHLS